VIRAVMVEDEAPARDKLRRWLLQEPDIDIVGEAEDGLTALRALTELAPDVVFLDIRIPEIDGLALAECLTAPGAPLIVFVTAHAEHAASAFDVEAVDYLLKPYDKERFDRCMGRIRQKLASRATARRPLIVPVRDELRLLDDTAIVWMEAEDNYVRIHTHERNYLLRRTLQDLLDSLDQRQFLRIHRSRAVNIAAIASLRPLLHGDAEIRLQDGKTLRVSRRYRHALKAWLAQCP
jgi:two-component system, LytTR family, response regulator